jgi:predicted DNA-binding transcriptional regulator AlpA
VNEDPAGHAAGHDLTVIRSATMKPPKPPAPITITLDLLAKNLDLIRTLPPNDLRTFGILANAVLAGINQALLSQPEQDKLLDVHEASIKLGMSKDYLYRNFRSLPFAVPMGKAKRFSSRGIARYLEQQKTD